MAIITGGALLGLAGCWPAPGQNPDRTAHNPLETELTVDSVGGLVEQWASAPLGGAVRDLTVAGDGVIAATGRSVHRLGRSDGSTDWSFRPQTENVGVSSAFVVDAGLLVGWGTSGGGGTWFASVLDTVTGAETQLLRDAGLVGGVRGSLAAGVSSSAVIAGPDTFYSLGTVDLDTGLASSRTLPLDRTLTLGSTRIYTSGVDPLAFPGVPAVTTYPVVGDPAVCPASGWPGTQVACPIWSTPTDGAPTAPVLGRGEQIVYVGTAGGDVLALDAGTGAIRWTADVGAAVTRPPALAEGVVYVGTAAGSLVALDAEGCNSGSCAPLWTASTGPDAVVSQPAVGGRGADAVVYVGTAAGEVVAYAAGGCGQSVCDSPLWSGSTGSSVSGAVIVSFGRVFAGTADGRVVAFGLPEG